MPTRGTILKTAFETYTVRDELGGGGSGVVYTVQTDSGIYAAKILRQGHSNQKLRRFKNELMFGVRENHPNLINVLDSGITESNEPFYVMPLASGTLRQLLVEGIAESERIALFGQMLDGVEAAHIKGVIHRDLKPENILIDSTRTIKIADFGIAHFEEEHLFTHVETSPSERLANWQYASPEQRSRGAQVDSRADIYSLGLILAEMFTGEVPHGIGGARVGEISPPFAYLDGLIDAMRQQDPANRPQTIQAVKRELISRSNTAIEFQKLDKLKNTVVKSSEVVDELANDLPSLINVIFTGSSLRFDLSRRVNSKWVNIFHNMPVAGLVGYGPERFKISLATAEVPSREHLAQQQIDFFKQYLDTANQLYVRNVAAEERERVQMERSNLQSEIERATNLAQIQGGLRW